MFDVTGKLINGAAQIDTRCSMPPIARRLEVHLVEQSDRPPASVFAVITIPAVLGTAPMLV